MEFISGVALFFAGNPFTKKIVNLRFKQHLAGRETLPGSKIYLRMSNIEPKAGVVQQPHQNKIYVP